MTHEDDGLTRARRLLEAQGVKYEREEHLCPKCTAVIWLVGPVDVNGTFIKPLPLTCRCNVCDSTVTLTNNSRRHHAAPDPEPSQNAAGKDDEDDYYNATNPWRK